ncbi:hypothetical protein M0D69_27465 [Caballeronia sp. SEWSISQ10-4 2]|uniref:hypothetical protein n=1 Tax=Caballeronia sp. SEWSISQ10-4 2 TaxID=2937438 RepID=UPI00265543DE|nr:hypothetical protein [Caballeronia sp. SEWSISQ10-4 2]MDN7181677.1 hypothetical protein [Caballeronia sp. SEWSISQ10-4 2]
MIPTGEFSSEDLLSSVEGFFIVEKKCRLVKRHFFMPGLPEPFHRKYFVRLYRAAAMTPESRFQHYLAVALLCLLLRFWS